MAARDHFNSRLGFILASAGSAVGLGNIWKFPFEVGAGGGAAFVIVYLTFAFILCFPVMVAEISIGRRTKLNPVGAFRELSSGKWTIVGYMGVASGFLILSFYNVVAAWAFGYFVHMVMGNFQIGQQFSEFTQDWIVVGSYSIVFMLTTAFVVSKGVSHGIEKAAKILMPTLLFFVIALVIYALTLPHAMEGVKYYLSPDFSKITGEVVYKALGQAFFSLSLGMGALITYGSYVSKDTNIVKAAATITLVDVGVAFLAGLMMFPFVAYMTGGEVSAMQEVSGGPGFIFVTLPGIFETLGSTLGVVVGAGFFLLLSFAALTSTISLLEVPTAYAVDELKAKRSTATWVIALLIFLIGVPSMLSMGTVDWLTSFVKLPGMENSISFMDFVGLIANDTFLPLGGFLISIFTAYVWKKRNFNAEIALGDEEIIGSPLQMYVDFAISYICPLILGSIAFVTILKTYVGIDLLG